MGLLFFSQPDHFVPADLPGCVLWLRSDLGVTLGTGVSAWADQSGAGNNVTQATGAKQPTFSAADAAFGAKPSLAFAAASVQVLNGAAAMGLAQPDTWYVVGLANQGAANGGFVDSNGARQLVNVALTTSNLGLFAGTAVVASATPVTAASVMCAVFNGAASALYVNASQTNLIAGNPGAGAVGTLAIGGIAGGSLNGTIVEVIAYNSAHDGPTRARVMQYLGARYGIATS